MTKERFQEIINYIGECIKGSEFENHVFTVGGCVRDTVMGNPIKDIDICVDIPEGGIKLAEYMHNKKLIVRPPITYPTYGTAMFKFKRYNQEEIECVHTRGEKYYNKDSRNPQVTFADLYEDSVRRDLTINSLYMNVSTNEVIDPTGNGFQDIKDGICRVTNEQPDIVFMDDPLRILRVIRFAVRYNFDIDEDTSSSMKKNADRLSIITRERITDEFCKMMLSPDPARALDLMRYYGVMGRVVPEVEKMVGLEQNEYHFGDVWSHTSKVVENLSNTTIKVTDEWLLPVRIAGLLHDIGKIRSQMVDDNGKIHFYEHEIVGCDIATDILKEMRISNSEIKKVVFLIKNHMRTKQWGASCENVKDKKFNKFVYECGSYDALTALMCLIDADNMAHKTDKCIEGQGEVVINKAKGSPMFGYKLPIDGNVVCKTLSIGPSRDVKKYLKHCLKLAFSNPGITYDECVYHIKKDKISL